MPTLEEILPKLNGAKVFTTLDAKDGFYQIGLDEESSKLTTFWTPFGRYRYLRLPFGISVAPEEFECKLQEKLSDLEGTHVLRDDILVVGYGDTVEEAEKNHDENLRKVLAMRTELVITCVTSCVSFVWIVFLVKKRLDRFKRLDRLNDRSFGSF